jgi:hypothetical protein
MLDAFGMGANEITEATNNTILGEVLHGIVVVASGLLKKSYHSRLIAHFKPEQLTFHRM